MSRYRSTVVFPDISRGKILVNLYRTERLLTLKVQSNIHRQRLTASRGRMKRSLIIPPPTGARLIDTAPDDCQTGAYTAPEKTKFHCLCCPNLLFLANATRRIFPTGDFLRECKNLGDTLVTVCTKMQQSKEGLSPNAVISYNVARS